MGYRSEDTIFLYAVTPGVSNMKQVHKAITEFCKKKKLLVHSDRFNLIAFHKEGKMHLENFTLNPDHIFSALKQLEEDTVQANVVSGIYLAIQLIIEVFKRISERSFHLVIIIDSGSQKIPTKDIPTLEHVIDKVKEMPLLLDIISINIEDSFEEFKLRKLASRTSGDLYKIKKVRELTSVFNILTEKKENPSLLNYEESMSITHISKENFTFYENFADKPLEIRELNTCSICFQRSMNLIQCTVCSTFAHKNCWALWSKTSHIGKRNVFRCHNCFNLLKLERELVETVDSGIMILDETPLVEVQKYVDEIKVINVEAYLESIGTQEEPKIIKIEHPIKIIADDKDDIQIIVND